MKHERQWIIIGATNPDPVNDTFDVVYYSKYVGWTDDLSSASIFDEEEKSYCSLPQGGQWLEIGAILND